MGADTLGLGLRREEGVSPVGRPSKFTPEFQRDAVDLVLSSGRPVIEVARELGVGNETLRSWVNRRRHGHGRGLRPPRRREARSATAG
ncbi:transposase [Dactylosporangium sp. NPDC005572]|uniref:transposase n=1 Tax=Dactylosporangium sp. NPDC005572 TaxID=3156889 RepID=UPI0033A5D34C